MLYLCAYECMNVCVHIQYDNICIHNKKDICI